MPPQTSRDTSLEQIVESSRTRFRTVEDMVIYVVRRAITAGIFRPGERLPQDQLAAMLEVSRMPIRAALRQLESEGLVVNHPHRGARVRALSPEEISDLFEMMILLETYALRKVVAVAGNDDLARLETLADRLEESQEDEDWVDNRQVFYRTLYSLGNTARAVGTIMQFRAEVSRYLVGLSPRRSKTHRMLLDRLWLRDADAAAAWLAAHLRKVGMEMQRQLEQRA